MEEPADIVKGPVSCCGRAGARIAGWALLVQLAAVIVVWVYLPRKLATGAVMYFYYPVARLLGIAGIGRLLPVIVIIVFVVPGTGMLVYSAIIGLIATTICRYRRKR